LVLAVLQNFTGTEDFALLRAREKSYPAYFELVTMADDGGIGASKRVGGVYAF
jgi:hypothetical protein